MITWICGQFGISDSKISYNNNCTTYSITWMISISCSYLPKMQDGWCNIPLIGACQEGHAETAQILLDHGAVADYKNKVFFTNIHACSHGCVMIISDHKLL